jgi:hypothetical protein
MLAAAPDFCDSSKPEGISLERQQSVSSVAGDSTRLVGQKTLFASKPCVAPIFCVFDPSIHRLTNKIL